MEQSADVRKTMIEETPGWACGLDTVAVSRGSRRRWDFTTKVGGIWNTSYELSSRHLL
jgi:hypothetical protein